MARNGSGTYTLPAGNPVVTGAVISSATHNSTMSDIANALTGSLAANGETTPTANLPMGAFKLTGLGAGVAATDSLNLAQAQAQASNWCGTAGGTANALTLSPNPAISAYAAGQVFRFKSGAAPNSAATTVAISGLATVAIQSGGAACAGGEILASQWYEIIVDASATSCQLQAINSVPTLKTYFDALYPSSSFRPHAASTPNMTVLIDAGKLQNSTTKVSQAQQTTTTFTAPSANPRNDLIIIDQATAAYSIVAGTESASPADPAIPSNKIAVARVRLTVGMPTITDSSIDDLRPGFYVPASSSGASIQGAFKNLKLVASGLTNTSAVITADQVITYDGTTSQLASAVSLAINSTASGANGLDTGTVAGSTWYSAWVIMKTDGTTAGLLSASATAPTMPAGYTFKARIGWVRTDGTANKYLLQTVQYGKRAQYVVLATSNVAAMPIMASGVAGSVTVPTWAAVAVGNYVPSTASAIIAHLTTIAGSSMLAPNASYGASGSSTNPPLVDGNSTVAVAYGLGNASMVLETTNIYWASSNSSNAVFCLGWEDNI